MPSSHRSRIRDASGIPQRCHGFKGTAVHNANKKNINSLLAFDLKGPMGFA
jgi:hypothetical protein